jgi:transcriptional regulator with XRE-family HTH domain
MATFGITGEQLKHVLERAGYSQREFARFLQCSHAFVSDLTRRKGEIPSRYVDELIRMVGVDNVKKIMNDAQGVSGIATNQRRNASRLKVYSTEEIEAMMRGEIPVPSHIKSGSEALEQLAEFMRKSGFKG